MNTDESAWSRRGTEPIVGPEVRTLVPRQGVDVDIRGDVDARGAVDAREPADRTRDVMSLILSGPALAAAAFAFAFAQLMGGLVPGELASMIPGAADSPTNHVRIVSLFGIGMAGVGIALAAAAFVRLRSERAHPHVSTATATWAGWLAGAAVVICAIVSIQALLLIILSALAPPGAAG
jgi:uncharacterized membrane protein YidH (DUF202 family)